MMINEKACSHNATSNSFMYRDFSQVKEDELDLLAMSYQGTSPIPKILRSGDAAIREDKFPVRLHCMLAETAADSLDNIVSWQPHGRSFRVHKQAEFVKDVLPLWFTQSKYTSFQRQLNIYGFVRIAKGPNMGGYYHELFLRGRPALAMRMPRCPQKNHNAQQYQRNQGPHPNFYDMTSLPPSMVCTIPVAPAAVIKSMESHSKNNVVATNHLAASSAKELCSKVKSSSPSLEAPIKAAAAKKPAQQQEQEQSPLSRQEILETFFSHGSGQQQQREQAPNATSRTHNSDTVAGALPDDNHDHLKEMIRMIFPPPPTPSPLSLVPTLSSHHNNNMMGTSPMVRNHCCHATTLPPAASRMAESSNARTADAADMLLRQRPLLGNPWSSSRRNNNDNNDDNNHLWLSLLQQQRFAQGGGSNQQDL